MLAHLARQVGEYLVPFGYLNLEGCVSHAFDDGSVHRNHIFSWNDITSFFVGAGCEARANSSWYLKWLPTEPAIPAAASDNVNAMLDRTSMTALPTGEAARCRSSTSCVLRTCRP